MNVDALDHVNIITDKLDATAEFYSNLLGLVRKDAPPPLTPETATWMFDAQDRAIIHINSLDCRRTYDREIEPGSLTGALHHVALRCTGYDEVKGRLDAMGAEYKVNLVSAINLRQIFTPDPNNVLLELNFFADLRAPMTKQSAGTASNDLVGTWQLAAIEMLNEQGEWAPAPMAGRPLGMLIYDGRGNMAIQITTDPLSSESNRAPFEFQHGYLAYYGTYELDEATHMVTHHRVAQNYAPDGSGDVRRYAVDGDSLTLTLEASLSFCLRWVRCG